MNRHQLKKLEDDRWAAVDNLRANSAVKAFEYGTPVPSLIYHKELFAEKAENIFDLTLDPAINQENWAD